jgi:predicted transcriptional regulator
MPTTSLKLSPELKKRVAAAAGERGVTPHAFMLGAIEESARAAELRAAFVTQAEDARKALLRTGKGYEADAVHAHLRNRLKGIRGPKPRAVAWRG